ncbi:hypothetical protein AOQ84DRAFT_68414 [Glonium stellatum]|uniref:Uncharacterized protein n=1 Tax=Glonium stellatum TaxID=574774 RepID=A0A8E2EXT0_9PEZI|nr:hypothetical protein AOQ84DRAFT_68414 [Glonium stellatum]
MASDYSPWVWSPEHQRHYCWRHNEEGVIEYQWSGPPVQTQASNVPRTVPSSSQPEGGYSYSSTSAQTSAPSQVTQAHGEEDEVEDEEEEGAEDDEEDDEDDDDDGDDDDDDDDNGEGSAEGSQQPSQTALAQKSWPHRTPGYPQSTAHGAPITYNPNYRSVQQPAPSNTSPHYTYRQPSYPNSVQPAVSPPAQQGSQQKVRHIRTGADGKDNEALDPRYKRVSPRSCASFFCYGRVLYLIYLFLT